MQKAEFRAGVEALGIEESTTPYQALASVMTFLAIQPITLFNQRKMHHFSDLVSGTAPQTILNITNMRIIGLTLFLKAVITQMSFCETLGSGMSPKNLYDHLLTNYMENVT